MNSLTIFHGATQPIRVRGTHCVRLVQFGMRYPGWHTFAQDRTTRKVISAVSRAGCVEVSGDQFRFVFPSVLTESAT